MEKLKIPESNNIINSIIEAIYTYKRDHEGYMKGLSIELTPGQYDLLRVQKDCWKIWDYQKPQTLMGIPFSVNYE